MAQHHHNACAAWLMIVVLLVGCTSQEEDPGAKRDKRLSDRELAMATQAATEEDILHFGFDLRASPQEDARQYLPLLKYLEQKTGYRFRLRFTPEDGQIDDDLGKGVLQFAAIGATSYIRAARQYGVIPLVRGVNSEGKAEYRSMIVVRPGSPIEGLDDIYGKRFAFGSINSTQGHLIPRIILHEHGIKLADLKAYEYTGSHQRCADAVISGRLDVCGMQDSMAKELARQELVRIIFRSQYFPSSGVAANKDVPPKVIARVKDALLDFRPTGRDAAGFYHWHRTEMPNGFVPASDSDYEELRRWMGKLRLSI